MTAAGAIARDSKSNGASPNITGWVITALPAWLQEALTAQQQVMIKVLMRGWSDRPSRLLRAALAHAINFYTYRSLVHDQGLKIEEALELMMQFVSWARTKNPD